LAENANWGGGRCGGVGKSPAAAAAPSFAKEGWDGCGRNIKFIFFFIHFLKNEIHLCTLPQSLRRQLPLGGSLGIGAVAAGGMGRAGARPLRCEKGLGIFVAI